MMNEADFISSIDCSFPCEDENKWKKIMTTAVEISPNAMFMVLYEICRVPSSLNISTEELFNMISEWEKLFEHPLKEIVAEAAKSIIMNELFSEKRTLKYFEKVAAFHGQYNALSIVYFACEECSDKIEDSFSKIMRKW